MTIDADFASRMQAAISQLVKSHDNTIKWLNRHQEHRLIRFLGDGTGEGVCWELISDAAPVLPAAAPKQTKKLRPAA